MGESWNTVYTVDEHKTYDSLLHMIRIYVVVDETKLAYYQSDIKIRFIALCKEVGIDLHPNDIRYCDREFTISMSSEDITRLRIHYSDTELLKSISKRLQDEKLLYSVDHEDMMFKLLKLVPLTSAINIASIDWNY